MSLKDFKDISLIKIYPVLIVICLSEIKSRNTIKNLVWRLNAVILDLLTHLMSLW